ncbi:MAG: M23 family metallopeptidase, partial [Desulfotomaculales bacterium]
LWRIRRPRVIWPAPAVPLHSRWKQGLARRSLLVLVVFLVILAVKETNGPLSEELRGGLRYVLTTEWNYQPVIEKVVRYGLQTVNVDLPFFDVAGTQPAARVTKQVDILTLPASGEVVGSFGWHTDAANGLERFHPGVDIACAPDTPVRAVLDGVVLQVGEDGALGPYVLVEHGDKTTSLYAHLREIKVKEGDPLKAGQVIATVGEQGDFPGPGLHFEFREKGELIDPLTRFTLTGKE